MHTKPLLNIKAPPYLGLIMLIIIVGVLTASCSDITTNASEIIDDPEFEPSDWTDASHGKSAQPDFDEVFDNSLVKRIDIDISATNWQVMLDDMTALYGDFGAGNSGPPGGGPPGGGPPDGNSFSEDNPVFVPADIYYNDIQWYKVGVRFKGNSSLVSSWMSGILKLSFKLDFDEFEDDYPQINNQRFYGFKKLSLKNNFEDKSQIREKVTAEIFENAGLAVSHTAFYEVYLNRGDGPEYFGLYTMVEQVDDTVIETQFSNDEGNVYKPENDGATFAAGTFTETDFEKKTNEGEGDWTDIQNLFDILHDESRLTDSETWRANLDSVFNTDVFLKYLAVNTIIQNWDTYGLMPHNYYLYNNPEDGKLTWIPWDNNEALQEGKMGGSLHLDFSDLELNVWPLIEYLYGDDVYKVKYDNYLLEIREGAFDPLTIQALYATYAELVEPYATTEEVGYTFLSGAGDFQIALSELENHSNSRANAVDSYLQ